MTVNTFQPQKNKTSSNVFIYVLALVGVGLLIYAGISVFTNIGNIRGKSALTVNSLNSNAQVLIDDEPVGDTPYESREIDVGDHKITVKNDTTTYEVSLAFEPNAQVVINRDLGISSTFSSGQNFWLEEDAGPAVSIISEPTGAKVFVDNTEVGVTPYSSTELTAGEYDLRVEHPDYETQNARIQVVAEYKLNVALTLFPMPVPSTVTTLEDADDLYDVSSSSSTVIADTQSWVSALLYWNSTRGINLSGSGVNKEPVFDYFLDYKGNVYDNTGMVVTDLENASLGERGAYLGKLSDGLGLSAEAQAAYESLGGAVTTGRTALILETGLGWLRVRDAAGTAGEELTRVDVGEEFPVLEEGSSWVKIQVDADTEGWVSATYVEITEN